MQHINGATALIPAALRFVCFVLESFDCMHIRTSHTIGGSGEFCRALQLFSTGQAMHFESQRLHSALQAAGCQPGELPVAGLLSRALIRGRWEPLLALDRS